MTMERLIEAVERLTPRQRRIVLARLSPAARPPQPAFRTPNPAAVRRFLALAGTGKSRFRDVSANKYKHLGEIYASRP